MNELNDILNPFRSIRKIAHSNGREEREKLEKFDVEISRIASWNLEHYTSDFYSAVVKLESNDTYDLLWVFNKVENSSIFLQDSR
ncbi:hypothetical protein TNCT_241911 [Trichonephila clavata]|uniref:Uncharacterized protein n=1 Tax=Trichonephila clavata TaxID=2740835 RepID=A0A8X6LWB9_TRICU|nr:hypothetical protein TNCT_241911 [Trichonephila clavata]